MGGAQSCILAGTGIVDVAVVAHLAPLNKEDFEKVNVPISFICSENGLSGTSRHILCCRGFRFHQECQEDGERYNR
jgi:hypothetical protein